MTKHFKIKIPMDHHFFQLFNLFTSVSSPMQETSGASAADKLRSIVKGGNKKKNNGSAKSA